MRLLHSLDNLLCEETDDNGNTALIHACSKGSKEAIEVLIGEFKVDIHKVGKGRLNCFLTAVYYGQHDILTYLHSIDEDLHKKVDNNGYSALLIASQYGYLKTVELLIQNFNADVYKVNLRGMNSFHLAVTTGKLDILKYLHSTDESLCRATTSYPDNMGRSTSNPDKSLLSDADWIYFKRYPEKWIGKTAFELALLFRKLKSIEFLISIKLPNDVSTEQLFLSSNDC